MRTFIFVATLLTFVAGVASAADVRGGRVGAAYRITILDSELVQPSALTMRAGDVLEFDNHSAQTMLVVFSPREGADTVDCRLVGADATVWTAAPSASIIPA
jgi:hypothetical protein